VFRKTAPNTFALLELKNNNTAAEDEPPDDFGLDSNDKNSGFVEVLKKAAE
jgi:hypothetical protein